MPSSASSSSDRGELARQLSSFAVIGVACTAAFAVLYSFLRGAGVAPLPANAVALLATMGANFAANRRHTFDARGGSVVHQFAGYAVAYALGLAASSAALTMLLPLLDHPRGALDTFAAFIAGLFATVVRFTLMRSWVFADARRVARP
jgi:putative flippase GtrA